MSNVTALAPRRVLAAASRLPDRVLHLFCEDMHDLLQFGGSVHHSDFEVALARRVVTVRIAGTVNRITDDDLSKIVLELARHARPGNVSGRSKVELKVLQGGKR